MKNLLLLLLLFPCYSKAQDLLKAYNNYDFVPGDTILFEDHFTHDALGEFPDNWELISGQAVVNNVYGYPSFLMTDGNYCRVKPRMKAKSYLDDRFSIEFDTYVTHTAYGLIIYLRDGKGNNMNVSLGPDKVTWNYSNTKTMAGKFPPELVNESYFNKWHHIAMAYKLDQLKVYVDQYRILSIPSCGLSPSVMECASIGSSKNPVIFTGMKIAKGAAMYVSGQKFTDTKIVTHGINFDVNKSTIKPESMGTLNMIALMMKENPGIKFEIGGYTDSDGDDASNVILSQQRADAVKAQLVIMGIEDTRLTTKGYGKSKPIGDNNTPEGKANNRRVEFVKI
jgi:OmpA-OmpF porin, OOP family